MKKKEYVKLINELSEIVEKIDNAQFTKNQEKEIYKIYKFMFYYTWFKFADAEIDNILKDMDKITEKYNV